MSPCYASCAYSNYASFGWSDLHWLWRPQTRWYTRSSAAVLITVTVCCIWSMTVCWQNSRLSRMQQCVSWPKQGSLITLHQCCINFTGFWCISESPSSWLWSPLSAFVVWRCLTWLTCASPFHQSSAGGSCGRLIAGHSSYNAPGLVYDRSARLCCVRPSHTEQPPRRTADFITVFSDVCEKNSKIIYLAASASADFCLTGAI